MDRKKAKKLLEDIDRNQENIDKIETLLKYRLPDEDGYTPERPLSIEIGGPATHAVFYPRTRQQAERIHMAVLFCISEQIEKAEAELGVICEEVALKFNNDLADAMHLKKSIDEGKVQILITGKEEMDAVK